MTGPMIESKEVRMLMAKVRKLINDIGGCCMPDREYQYMQAEVENAFAATLRQEVFNGNP